MRQSLAAALCLVTLGGCSSQIYFETEAGTRDAAAGGAGGAGGATVTGPPAPNPYAPTCPDPFCPSVAPVAGDSCCVTESPCTYESTCGEAGTAVVASCDAGRWTVQHAVCTPCHQADLPAHYCLPGEVCTIGATYPSSYECRPNPCAWMPLSCACAQPLCDGLDCHVEGAVVICQPL